MLISETTDIDYTLFFKINYSLFHFFVYNNIRHNDAVTERSNAYTIITETERKLKSSDYTTARNALESTREEIQSIPVRKACVKSRCQIF